MDNPAEIQIFLPGVKPLPELQRSIAAGGYGASGTSSSAAKTPARDAKISRDLFEDPYVPGKRVRLIGHRFDIQEGLDIKWEVWSGSRGTR